MRVVSLVSTSAQIVRRKSARSDFAVPLRGIRTRSAALMAWIAARVSCSGSPQPMPIRESVSIVPAKGGNSGRPFARLLSRVVQTRGDEAGRGDTTQRLRQRQYAEIGERLDHDDQRIGRRERRNVGEVGRTEARPIKR